jgi:ParB family chromosome partitioning protein
MAEKSRKGLGKGMGALFGEDINATAEENEKDILTLPITKVEPRQDQPRKHFDEELLEELAESIRTYGLIQPITVRKLESGYYQIIAGERRWRAARIAGLREVPVRIIEADDQKAMELALVENLQREDLNPIEEARGFRKLMDEYGMTQEVAAERVGKSRPAVANSLRLLSLSAPVLQLVEDGKLPAGHARALIPIDDDAVQLEAANAIIEQGMSARQAEALSARLQRQLENPKPEAEESDSDEPTKIIVDYTEQVRLSLEKVLARKVKITDGRKRGKIEIEFYGADDRENLINALLTLKTQPETTEE